MPASPPEYDLTPEQMARLAGRVVYPLPLRSDRTWTGVAVRGVAPTHSLAIRYAVAGDGTAYRYRWGLIPGRGVADDWQVDTPPLVERGTGRQYVLTVDGRQRPYAAIRLLALAVLGAPPEPGAVAVLREGETAVSPETIEWISRSEHARRKNAAGLTRHRIGPTVREARIAAGAPDDADAVTVRVPRRIADRLRRIHPDGGTLAEVVVAILAREASARRPAGTSARIADAVRRTASVRALALARLDLPAREIASRLSREYGQPVSVSRAAEMVRDGLRAEGAPYDGLRSLRRAYSALAADARRGMDTIPDLARRHRVSEDEARAALARRALRIRDLQDEAVRRMAREMLADTGEVDAQAISRRSPLPYPVVRDLCAETARRPV